MKIRSDLHLPRRIFHMLGVGIIIVLYQSISRMDMMLFLTTLTVVCLAIDFLRLKSKKMNRKLVTLFGNFIRKSEVGRLTGMSYLLSGVLIISIFFPKEIVILSLLLLAIGDPVSSIFGILYGKDILIGTKTLQGAIAGFLSCTVVALIYFSITGYMADRIILASLVVGLIGAISEMAPIFDLDDNLTFPVLSSCFLWIQFQIM